MNLDESTLKLLPLNELLFLYFNIKGYKNTNSVNKMSNENVAYFQCDSQISSSKKSKESFISPEFTSLDKDKWLNCLNDTYSFFDSKFEQASPTSKAKVKIVFSNNRNLNLAELMSLIYQNIFRKLVTTPQKEFKRLYALNAFGFRGSFDLTANFVTSDIHSSRNDTVEEIKELMKLTVSSELDSQLNLNFRELQGEGKARDTQFRINLKYFNDNFLDGLNSINPYRYNQFLLNQNQIRHKHERNSEKGNEAFLKRLVFFRDNIINKSSRKMPRDEINRLRNELNLSNKSNISSTRRNNHSKEIADELKPDICVSCKQKYAITDRTFITTYGRPYLELHHVISHANIKNGIYTEMPENFVKLCPACHRALTPNRAPKDYQKEIVSNIFKNDIEAKQFVIQIQKNIQNSDTLIDFTVNHLK